MAVALLAVACSDPADPGERPDNGERSTASDAGASYSVWTRLRSAAGMAVRGRVLVAGLPVGEVERMTLEGRRVRVTMRIHGDVVLWPDAVVSVRPMSLPGDGEYYLEIDPGTRRTGKPLGDGDYLRAR